MYYGWMEQIIVKCSIKQRGILGLPDPGDKYWNKETINYFKFRYPHINISSYLVKEEDAIEIRDKSKQLAIIDIALANKERETPEYIQMDEKNKKLKFVRVPKFEEVPYPIVMEPNLVIEYYSR